MLSSLDSFRPLIHPRTVLKLRARMNIMLNTSHKDYYPANGTGDLLIYDLSFHQ